MNGKKLSLEVDQGVKKGFKLQRTNVIRVSLKNLSSNKNSQKVQMQNDYCKQSFP